MVKAALDVPENATSQDHVIDSFVADPFKPLTDLPDEKDWVMSPRAVLVGVVAGALVNASNVYLGLKSGCKYPAMICFVALSIGHGTYSTALLP